MAGPSPGRTKSALAVVLGWILFMLGSLAIFTLVRLTGLFAEDLFLVRLVTNLVATIVMLFAADRLVRRRIAPAMAPIRFAGWVGAIMLAMLALVLATGASDGALAAAIGVLLGLVLFALLPRSTPRS
jgi:hypothetical protein